MALRQLKNENRSLFFLHVVESYPTLFLPLHHIILFGFFLLLFLLDDTPSTCRARQWGYQPVLSEDRACSIYHECLFYYRSC